MTTVYTNSSNLSDAHTDGVIRILDTDESKNTEALQTTHLNCKQKSSSTVEIKRICSPMTSRENILSLEKFEFPDLTFHKSKERGYDRENKYYQCADLKQWLGSTNGGG